LQNVCLRARRTRARAPCSATLFLWGSALGSRPRALNRPPQPAPAPSNAHEQPYPPSPRKKNRARAKAATKTRAPWPRASNPHVHSSQRRGPAPRKRLDAGARTCRSSTGTVNSSYKTAAAFPWLVRAAPICAKMRVLHSASAVTAPPACAATPRLSLRLLLLHALKARSLRLGCRFARFRSHAATFACERFCGQRDPTGQLRDAAAGHARGGAGTVLRLSGTAIRDGSQVRLPGTAPGYGSQVRLQGTALRYGYASYQTTSHIQSPCPRTFLDLSTPTHPRTFQAPSQPTPSNFPRTFQPTLLELSAHSKPLRPPHAL